jgi:hypothetical protein
MLSTPLTRIAQCAAVMAVLSTVLFPPQSLVCRNCLVHELSSFGSEAEHARHDHLHSVDDAKHGHFCDSSEHCESDGDSHENCPCELMQVDVAMAFSPSVAQKFNIEFVAHSFSVDLHAATSVRCTIAVDSYSTSRPPSLPLVLRI